MNCTIGSIRDHRYPVSYIVARPSPWPREQLLHLSCVHWRIAASGGRAGGKPQKKHHRYCTHFSSPSYSFSTDATFYGLRSTVTFGCANSNDRNQRQVFGAQITNSACCKSRADNRCGATVASRPKAGIHPTRVSLRRRDNRGQCRLRRSFPCCGGRPKGRLQVDSRPFRRSRSQGSGPRVDLHAVSELRFDIGPVEPTARTQPRSVFAVRYPVGARLGT